MKGPEIIARTMSVPGVDDKFGRRWQYHSRSDLHSKVACWAILFDMLQSSSLLQQHVLAGKVTFGINRKLHDWESEKTKNLDLVVARTPGPGSPNSGKAFDLADLADRYGVILTDDEAKTLAKLPVAPPGTAGATVLVALEAKACMTAHIKALPRLHDELTSSHATVHGDNPNALAIGFVMINYADTFISPDRNRREITEDHPAQVSQHRQPHDTDRTLDMISKISRRSGPGTGGRGFDAIGIMLVSMTNDGAPVTVVTPPPAPGPTDAYHYDQMINRAAHLYDSNFGHIA
ncbi:MAG: hypothetical protein GEV28_27905 [Actinophytocola sp.]|uniref:hypothetical protein n=1 Tax=Actinophytocola sp. TaxID=1872138 RepID=UPI0013254D78|nr:hypothetical protein [Actinophytocola sp.]MPZ84011.1 hypothetical protein [Actinophytocola sp.]